MTVRTEAVLSDVAPKSKLRASGLLAISDERLCFDSSRLGDIVITVTPSIMRPAEIRGVTLKSTFVQQRHLMYPIANCRTSGASAASKVARAADILSSAESGVCRSDCQ